MSAFPKDPQDLLPHRPPLLLLDSVDAVDAGGARATLSLRPGNPFVNGQGVLERVAYAEIMAQCFAAFGADHADRTDRVGPSLGYLAALRDIHVLGDARLGDVLTAHARPTASLGGITVVEGEVWRGEELLASGQFKIFMPGEEA